MVTSSPQLAIRAHPGESPMRQAPAGEFGAGPDDDASDAEPLVEGIGRGPAYGIGAPAVGGEPD